MIVMVLAFLYNVGMALFEEITWSEFYLIHLVSDKLRWFILGESLIFMVFLFGMQKCVLEPITYRLIKKYEHKKWIWMIDLFGLFK